jgi:hypothetical protein
MPRPITIAIATMGLIALMFWLGMGATGKDAAVVSNPLKSEYALTSPNLPLFEEHFLRLGTIDHGVTSGFNIPPVPLDDDR